MTSQGHRTQIWHVDVVKMHGGQADRFLLAIIDPYSRKVLASNILQSVDSHEIVRFLERIVVKLGVPRTLLVDESIIFEAAPIGQWAASHGTQIVQSSARAPSTKGMVESVLKSIADNVRVPLRFRRR